MKTEIAIVAAAPEDDAVEEVKDLNEALIEAEENHDRSGQERNRRLLDLGNRLDIERVRFPENGRNAGSWSIFLSQCGISKKRASDARRYAAFVKACPIGHALPDPRDAGIDHNRPSKKTESDKESRESDEQEEDFRLNVAAGRLKSSVWKMVDGWPSESRKSAAPAVLRDLADEIENGHG